MQSRLPSLVYWFKWCPSSEIIPIERTGRNFHPWISTLCEAKYWASDPTETDANYGRLDSGSNGVRILRWATVRFDLQNDKTLEKWLIVQFLCNIHQIHLETVLEKWCQIWILTTKSWILFMLHFIGPKKGKHDHIWSWTNGKRVKTKSEVRSSLVIGVLISSPSLFSNANTGWVEVLTVDRSSPGRTVRTLSLGPADATSLVHILNVHWFSPNITVRIIVFSLLEDRRAEALAIGNRAGGEWATLVFFT